MAGILIARVELLAEQIPSEVVAVPEGVLLCRVVCDECGRSVGVPPPYDDPAGWQLGPFGGPDQCPDCTFLAEG